LVYRTASAECRRKARRTGRQLSPDPGATGGIVRREGGRCRLKKGSGKKHQTGRSKEKFYAELRVSSDTGYGIKKAKARVNKGGAGGGGGYRKG